MPKDDALATCYQLDRSDRIAWLGSVWNDFARQNEAPELSSDRVLGRPLWDYVTGVEVRHLYELMFDAVRRTGQPIVVPFRCDSSEVRRFMELEIGPLPEGALELRGSLLREERREPVPLFDARHARLRETLAVCSFCKRIPVPGAGWVVAEQAVSALHLFGEAELPLLSHSVCPDCRVCAHELVNDAEGSPPTSGP